MIVTSLAPMAVTGLLVAQVTLQPQPAADPLAFFQPLVKLSAKERQRISGGAALIRVLPGSDQEVAVFGAVPIRVDGERLVLWVRNIAELKKSSVVMSIRRFSDPPRIDDLDELALEDADLEDIRRCRPGDCEVKLAAAEIERLQGAIARADATWKPRLQQAFRELVLQRVEMYLTSGHAALSRYDDHDGSLPRDTAFSSIMQRSPYLTEQLPRFAEYLDRYPHAAIEDVESFVYWSKEHFAGKPVISATHVSIFRGSDPDLPTTLVAGKQIFATHYMDGALSVTAIVRDGSASQHYLTYLNRSRLDVLDGFFGGLVRSIIERRLRADASDLLQGFRRRLESGEPPS